jgi:hypothetical protein
MMLAYGRLDPLKVIVELLLLNILVRSSSDFNDWSILNKVVVYIVIVDDVSVTCGLNSRKWFMDNLWHGLL